MKKLLLAVLILLPVAAAVYWAAFLFSTPQAELLSTVVADAQPRVMFAGRDVRGLSVEIAAVNPAGYRKSLGVFPLTRSTGSVSAAAQLRPDAVQVALADRWDELSNRDVLHFTLVRRMAGLSVPYPFSGTVTVSKGEEPQLLQVRARVDQYYLPPATPGEVATITGEHFGTANGVVNMNGVPLPIEKWTDTAVTVKVPENTEPGNGKSIYLTTDRGIIVGPCRVDIHPAREAPTVTWTYLPPVILLEHVTVTGKHFGKKAGIVRVNGRTARVIAWRDTAMTFALAAGTEPGTGRMIEIKRSDGVALPICYVDVQPLVLDDQVTSPPLKIEM